MNSMYIAHRLNELRAESAAARLAQEARKDAGPNRLIAAVKSVWSLLAGPAERPSIPTNLSHAPFRS